MMPSTLRLAVFANATSVIAAISRSMAARLIPCLANATASSPGNLADRVEEGASGINTGSKVPSFTSSAS